MGLKYSKVDLTTVPAIFDNEFTDESINKCVNNVKLSYYVILYSCLGFVPLVIPPVTYIPFLIIFFIIGIIYAFRVFVDLKQEYWETVADCVFENIFIKNLHAFWSHIIKPYYAVNVIIALVICVLMLITYLVLLFEYNKLFGMLSDKFDLQNIPNTKRFDCSLYFKLSNFSASNIDDYKVISTGAKSLIGTYLFPIEYEYTYGGKRFFTLKYETNTFASLSGIFRYTLTESASKNFNNINYCISYGSLFSFDDKDKNTIKLSIKNKIYTYYITFLAMKKGNKLGKIIVGVSTIKGTDNPAHLIGTIKYDAPYFFEVFNTPITDYIFPKLNVSYSGLTPFINDPINNYTKNTDTKNTDTKNTNTTPNPNLTDPNYEYFTSLKNTQYINHTIMCGLASIIYAAIGKMFS